MRRLTARRHRGPWRLGTRRPGSRSHRGAVAPFALVIGLVLAATGPTGAVVAGPGAPARSVAARSIVARHAATRQAVAGVATANGCSAPAQTATGQYTNPGGDGYWLTTEGGVVRAYGNAHAGGSAPGSGSRVVGILPAPASGGGSSNADAYLQVTAGGIVVPSNGAPSYGDLSGVRLSSPIVGIAPAGQGYWLAAADGGVFAFGDAPFYGSMAGRHLNAPIVGIASAGLGYWLVAADGGVFAFGDARFFGSMAGRHLNAPIVGIATPRNVPAFPGYWLVAADGGVFSFGDARFLGSMGGRHLNAPIVAMAFGSDVAAGTDALGDQGYWLAGADGGVFAFGDVAFCGSGATQPAAQPVVGIASRFTPPL